MYKTHKNPLGNFKDLSKRSDRQLEGTLFYALYD
jgi:hypothetical protein